MQDNGTVAWATSDSKEGSDYPQHKLEMLQRRRARLSS